MVILPYRTDNDSTEYEQEQHTNLGKEVGKKYSKAIYRRTFSKALPRCPRDREKWVFNMYLYQVMR